MLHTKLTHWIILIAVIAIVGITQPLSLAQKNTTPTNTPSPVSDDPELRELERQKLKLELENQIEQLKKGDNRPTAIDEAQEKLRNTSYLLELVRIAFAGSGIASTVLVLYLVLGLFGLYPPDMSQSWNTKDDDATEEMLRSYHKQALAELKWNSALSLAASVFGVMIIFGGAMLALAGFTSAGIASGAMGIITEGVSYLFYRQTKEARARVRENEQQLFKYKIAKSLEDKTTKDAAKTKL